MGFEIRVRGVFILKGFKLSYGLGLLSFGC